MRASVWAPLDVGGLRLYRVLCRWIKNGQTVHEETQIVAALRPAHAARLIRAIYQGVDYPPEIIDGFALDVYMPRDWKDEGVPCIHEPERFLASRNQ